MNQTTSPKLSVVVAIVSDTTSLHSGVSQLADCLDALSKQVDPPPLEIIVPYHKRVENIDQIKQQYPEVKYVLADNLKTLRDEAGSREHHDEIRARGLAEATGDIIGLLEDHARPDVNWSRNIVRAHEQDVAGAGGAIENGIDRALNWAVYFCDFGKYQNPVPDGPSWIASDANVSYKRSALESILPVWKDIFHETMVNSAIIEKGGKLVLSPDIIVYQNRENLKLGDALKERFVWGRSYAGTRCNLISGPKRAVYALLSPILPFVLVFRMMMNVMKKGRCRGAFFKALPLTTLLSFSWSIGELVGYLTARSS